MSETRQELIYAHAASRLMTLATIKNQPDLVKAIFVSVLDVYGFTGVFTLFYVFTSARDISGAGELVRPGPEAGAGDRFGFELYTLLSASDFDGAWKLFDKTFTEGEPSEEIHVGVLTYFVNIVAAAAIEQAEALSDEDDAGSHSTS